METNKVVSVHIDENGNVYELKKPVYKKPLFWSTIITGVFAIFFLVLVFLMANEMVNYDTALRKNNVYYDGNTKDIYAINANQTTSSSSSEDVSDNADDSESKIDPEDPMGWIKGFAMLRDREELTWFDVIAIQVGYESMLDSIIKDNSTEEDKKIVSNGKYIMKQITEFYKNAEMSDRKINDNEHAIILSNLGELIKIVEKYAK